MGYVLRFSKGDCVEMLRNWLLSLMMCDVSFIISMSRLDCHDVKGLGNVVGRDNDSKKGDFDRSFECSARNELRVYTKNGCCFEYQIKVIDLDGKPAKKKIRNRKDL